MGRKDQHKMEAEKQELAKQETARHGKSLSSVFTPGGTSRQQVLAAKKREGKQVATAESVDADGRRSAHSKRSKEPKGKGVHGKVYNMTFKEIGQALGLQDLEESSIPILYDAPREENMARMVWKVLAGKTRKPSRDKNASIRHPSVRYLHRLIVHTIFPRKEPGTVNDEELQLLHQTVQHYAHPSQLPLVDADFYKNFGMVGFFVKRLVHYKEWAWTTSDSEPQVQNLDQVRPRHAGSLTRAHGAGETIRRGLKARGITHPRARSWRGDTTRIEGTRDHSPARTELEERVRRGEDDTGSVTRAHEEATSSTGWRGVSDAGRATRAREVQPLDAPTRVRVARVVAVDSYPSRDLSLIDFKHFLWAF
ncbi:hypothetical protein F2Q69_00061489 [Brassica cretica]|uniref:Arabidopsis retrotransposon Orf1 C-terminal domain-containing protein n=1 Tax=Brassica cretica TaxID=69181 RepID=A0A8S9RCU2_BRACR|nr:hypothetical protein F2Q69_00061489 [Brassica cretica]